MNYKLIGIVLVLGVIFYLGFFNTASITGGAFRIGVLDNGNGVWSAAPLETIGNQAGNIGDTIPFTIYQVDGSTKQDAWLNLINTTAISIGASSVGQQFIVLKGQSSDGKVNINTYGLCNDKSCWVYSVPIASYMWNSETHPTYEVPVVINVQSIMIYSKAGGYTEVEGKCKFGFKTDGCPTTVSTQPVPAANNPATTEPSTVNTPAPEPNCIQNLDCRSVCGTQTPTCSSGNCFCDSVVSPVQPELSFIGRIENGLNKIFNWLFGWFG
jgi:hypothetical protein